MKKAARYLALAMVMPAIMSLVIGLAGCAGGRAGSGAKDPGHFVSKVKPVLEYYCAECHNDKSGGKYGGLNIETRKAALTTGRHAPVILPGHPDESLFFIVLRLGHDEALGMPPAPDKVSDEQLAAVREWIRGGAPWPDGPEGRLKLPR